MKNWKRMLGAVLIFASGVMACAPTPVAIAWHSDSGCVENVWVVTYPNANWANGPMYVKAQGNVIATLAPGESASIPEGINKVKVSWKLSGEKLSYSRPDGCEMPTTSTSTTVPPTVPPTEPPTSTEPPVETTQPPAPTTEPPATEPPTTVTTTTTVAVTEPPVPSTTTPPWSWSTEPPCSSPDDLRIYDPYCKLLPCILFDGTYVWDYVGGQGDSNDLLGATSNPTVACHVPVPNPPTAEPTLPKAGSNDVTTSVIALGFLAAGSALLFASRRPRTSA